MNETEPANIRSYHSPRNEDCANNQDPALGCTCRKKRRPYRVVKVTDRNAGHNINPQIVISIWPNGTIELREARRRLKYSISAADLYTDLMRAAALAYVAAKRKAKRRAAKLNRKGRS